MILRRSLTGPFFIPYNFVHRYTTMKHLRLILLLTLLAGSAAVSEVHAQESPKATKAQRTADKKKEQQVKASAKAEEKGRKRHYNLQSKEVKKRMKRNKHRYDHVDSFDRRPNFIQRIFHRKPPSAY